MDGTHAWDSVSATDKASITDASQTGLDITGDMTIECWFNVDSFSGNEPLVAKDSAVSRGYNLFVASGSVGFIVNGTQKTVKVDSWTTGVWYHVALTYDASAGTANVYVMGKQVGQMTSLPTSIPNSSADFIIGEDGFASGFTGLIDDVRIYNDIRTASEINDNFQAEISGSTGNLQGYWKLNNDYTDETSNGNDLSATGSPAFVTTLPPDVYVLEGSSEVTDSSLADNVPDTNLESSNPVYIGEEVGGANAVQRGVMKFDFSNLPSYSSIDRILLLFHIDNEQASSDSTVACYRILQDIVYTECTWNIYSTGNSWGTAGCAIDDTDAESTNIGSISLLSTETVGFQQFTLTASEVEEWIDGTLTNNGMLIKTVAESNDRNLWSSTENANTYEYPKLIVYYTPLTATANRFIESDGILSNG
jgi:hypothetical protein